MVEDAAEQEEQEQTIYTDGHDLQPDMDSAGTSLFELTERKRQEDIRIAKEAKELAEEEECRRIWYGLMLCVRHSAK